MRLVEGAWFILLYILLTACGKVGVIQKFKIVVRGDTGYNPTLG